MHQCSIPLMNNMNIIQKMTNFGLKFPKSEKIVLRRVLIHPICNTKFQNWIQLWISTEKDLINQI